MSDEQIYARISQQVNDLVQDLSQEQYIRENDVAESSYSASKSIGAVKRAESLLKAYDKMAEDIARTDQKYAGFESYVREQYRGTVYDKDSEYKEEAFVSLYENILESIAKACERGPKPSMQR